MAKSAAKKEEKKEAAPAPKKKEVSSLGGEIVQGTTKDLKWHLPPRSKTPKK